MTQDLNADLRRLVAVAEADLRGRTDRVDLPWAASLKAEHQAALAAGRTAESWSQWRESAVTQGAVAWVLGCVFVRFCEDNDLIAGRWFAGPGDGLARAVDAETAFYAADPRRGTADWLRAAFGHLAALPGCGGILDRRHDPVWSAPLGDDVASALLAFWRETDAAGALLRDLASPGLDTRFLGDIYQDLSVEAKKRYALLQTPAFVQEFILDRTLTPAIAEFGLPGLRVIDPTCGSGHFLLGAFGRLQAAWRHAEPGAPDVDNARRALESVYGVDLNPYAAAIARFRLAVAALGACGFARLADAPDFGVNVAVGDSLLGGFDQGTLIDATGAAGFSYRDEDIHEHSGILERGTYHVVVGNPPYITVKDKALNEAYRNAWSTCHRQYALSVPFMELFFALAVRGSGDAPAGFVGQITSNSFMKREFGSKLIEGLLSGRDYGNPVDLMSVIDTSGAYIPGHGTPTVILLGRRRRPSAATVRAVLGVRGEPGQPADPAQGLVWREIVDHVDQPGYDGTYVSVTDLDRAVLAVHPWSLSGGGAGDVKEAMEEVHAQRIGGLISTIGRVTHTGADEAYFAPAGTWRRHGAQDSSMVPLVEGDTVRDYVISLTTEAIFPYDKHQRASLDDPAVAEQLWRTRSTLRLRREPGGTHEQIGLTWFEWSRWHPERFKVPLSIAFAEVATHNHFVLDRGGKVFKQTAPVIKLPSGAGEDEHLALLGILNSAAACFWLKQVSHKKGGSGIGRGIQPEDWMDRYAFNATRLQEFPLPAELPLAYGRVLDGLARELAACTPSAVAASGVPTRMALDAAHVEYRRIRALMIAWQEELDWYVYHCYGLIDEALVLPDGIDPPGITLGSRAFEIVLARRVDAGDEETAWFERHGSTPVTEIPSGWPKQYGDLVQRRLDAIASNPSIRLLERPENKRRWAARPWRQLEDDAVTSWILDRLEDPALWSDAAGPRVLSVAQLAFMLRADEGLLEACRTLTGQQDPDLAAVLGRLVPQEAVPFLAAQRYSDSGLAKRREWEAVWALQRREDGGEQVKIPVPPKYTNKDFRGASYWSARGKLDVPKERFIAYPGAQNDADPSLVVGWAGWDHADQARALARLLVERQQRDGWEGEEIVPLLAGLAELEPWLHQWHIDTVPGTSFSPALAITGLIDAQIAKLGMTRSDLAAWRPLAPARRRRAST